MKFVNIAASSKQRASAAVSWQPSVSAPPKVPGNHRPIHQRVFTDLPYRTAKTGDIRKMQLTGELGNAMKNGNSPVDGTSLGFLSVVKDTQYGLFGGYLLLNCSGRPLEFHCTAPIKPTRAQQILYGPTLEEFLYSEYIGQALLRQSKLEPLIICTDCPAALAVRQFCAAPVVLVLAQPEAPSQIAKPDGTLMRLDGPHRPSELLHFEVGPNRLAVPRTAEEDHRLAQERLQRWAKSLELAEPFERIRQAIEEAKQAGCQQA